MGVCRGQTEDDTCPVSELPGPPGHAQAGQVCRYVREDTRFCVVPPPQSLTKSSDSDLDSSSQCLWRSADQKPLTLEDVFGTVRLFSDIKIRLSRSGNKL